LEGTRDRSKLKRSVRDVFARYDTAGVGFVDQEQLVPLLRELSGKEPTKTDVLFALRSMDAVDGKVTLEELTGYWEKVKSGHSGAKLNKLLVKDRVGAVRVSSYDLPPHAHAFGRPNPEQEFSAGDVLGGWQGREGESPKKTATFTVPKAIDAFGRPNRPSTPVSEVIKTAEAAASREPVYPTLPSRKKDPLVPKSTTAAALRSTAVSAQYAEGEETKPWKMKRFEHVKSKLTAP